MELSIHASGSCNKLVKLICSIIFFSYKLYLQAQLTEHDGTTEDNKEMSCLRDEGAAPQAYVVTGPTGAEHDYDEPYFEPASEFDTLLEQLKELAVTNILKSSLRSVHLLLKPCSVEPLIKDLTYVYLTGSYGI